MMANAKEVLNDMALRLRTVFPGEVKDVVLFGSHNTGKATEDSDYDILLIWKGKKLAYEKKRAISDVCTDTDLFFGILTHTLVISEEELNDVRGAQPLFQDALAHGAYAL